MKIIAYILAVLLILSGTPWLMFFVQEGKNLSWLYTALIFLLLAIIISVAVATVIYSSNTKLLILAVALLLANGGLLFYLVQTVSHSINTMAVNYTIFPETYDSGMSSSDNWSPSEEDVQEAENILRECLKTEAPTIGTKFDQYRRQYFGIKNEKNEKIIWMNALHKDFVDASSTDNPDWRKERVDFEDGGDSFFNVKIDLQTRQCIDLHVNGEA